MAWFAICIRARAVKALVVDDDAARVAALVGALVKDGHSVDVCADAGDALRRAQLQHCDLLVLARGMSGLDALGMCRRLRALGRAEPILLLDEDASAQAGIDALDAGADDVVTMPLDVEALGAHVRALLRRVMGATHLHLGPLALDRVARHAWLDGGPLPLTPREYGLPAFLAEHAGRMVSRAELLARVWQHEGDPSSNIVEAHMSRLREKLGEHASLIETVRGAGYRLRT